MSKKPTLHVHHAFLYISLLSLHKYDVKWPDFKFICERERQRDITVPSLFELARGPLSSGPTKILFF